MTEASAGTRLALAIGRLNRQARVAAPTGLTASQLSTLATVVRGAPMRLSDLAQLEGVALPVMTRLVASLEELGLVAKQPSETDRRSVLIAATDDGSEKLNEVVAARAGAIEARLALLKEAERAALLAALPALELLAAK